MLSGFILLLIIALWWYLKNELRNKVKYWELEEKLTRFLVPFLLPPVVTSDPFHLEKTKDPKTPLNDILKSTILNKLKTFEKKQDFLEKGLTLGKLSKKLKTNDSYLS